MRVYEIYSKILKRFSEDSIYGVPGSFIMPLWWDISREHRVILARHESGAVFMADGYARATGNMGIAITTVGPGLTNAITGIACAYQDSVPLLVISGRGSVADEFKGIFQNSAIADRGFSSIDVLKAVTKKAFEPRTKEEAIKCLYEAIKIANSGRKGPVHISLPLDIQNEEVNCTINEADLKVEEKNCNQSLKFLEKISNYSRPIILCGWGTHLAKAGEELEKFSKKLHIPIVSTIKGISACSIANPYYWGTVGNILKKSVKGRIQNYNPDLVVAMGSSLSLNSCPEFYEIFQFSDIMQIDIDEKQLGYYRKVDYKIMSDIKVAIEYLNKLQLEKYECSVSPLKDNKASEEKFADIVKCMDRILTKDSIVIPDAGNHWIDTLYWYNPKSIFGLTTNNGLGSMGHAIGSAIGIARAMPEKKVICISGDGSVLMSGGEISTAVNYNVNIIFVIENNGGLGRVRIGQLQNEVSTESSTIEKVSIKKYAESLGAKAFCCSDINSFEKTMKDVLRMKGTIVVEVLIDKDDCPTALGV